MKDKIDRLERQLEDAEKVISKIWTKDSLRDYIDNYDSTSNERSAIDYWDEYYPTGFRKFVFHGSGLALPAEAIVLSSDSDKALKIANKAQDEDGRLQDMELYSQEPTTLKGQCTLIQWNGDY